jgi:branched-chain amino acid aminotransferase
MATTFEFREGRPVGRTTAATLGEASAALPVGSYTTLRTYGGSGVVRLTLHARRLVESLPPDKGAPLETDDLRAALAHALRETRHPESRLRVTFVPPRLFVSVEPFAPPDPALLRTGVACMTIRMQRDRPEAKDSRFLATAQSAYAALPAMVHEGLMVDPEGAILEGLSSNFFAIRGGALHTEEARVLPGLTRALVLEVAAQLLPRADRALRQDELALAQECFITSASRGVLPVVRIDETTIAGGAPGPLSREIRRRYDRQVAAEAEAVERG